MSENVVMSGVPLTAPPRWRPGRAVLGAALGLGGHVVALVGAFIAGRTADRGQDFDDLAAVAVTFLGTEGLVLLIAVGLGGLLLARGRRDLGAGLLGGWLVGAIFCTLVLLGVVPVS
ncbi:hypothetical protein GCM10009682_44490 [Luedemannella flava]|uniref:DUF4064 domain-containing protein n=1 Tax=Luedemannella flava TaxID=349316 RepID=A0ABN2MBJ4_9ACTN